MAWNTRWQMQFRSLNQTLYTVNIMEQDYTGEVIQLTPSDHPFTTQEDDDDDIFIPIRVQTGYLRVIDQQGGLLDSIIADNDTQRLVEVKQGDTIVWRGFMKSQTYTQDWLNEPSEVSIQVQSVLGVLSSVTIDEQHVEEIWNPARILYEALTIIDAAPQSVMMVNSPLRLLDDFFLPHIKMSSFFTSEEYLTDDGTYLRNLGTNYHDILESVALLHGASIREKGDIIYITWYDTDIERKDRIKLAWKKVQDMAQGLQRKGEGYTIDTNDLFTSVSIKGDDSSQSIIQGRNAVEVELSLDTSDNVILSMPQTIEDASTVYKVEPPSIEEGTLEVQPHTPRSNGRETTWFLKYLINLLSTHDSDYGYFYWWKYTYQSVSNYSDFVNNSFFVSPGIIIGDNTYLYTGACPCRFAYSQDGKISTLTSGMFFTMQSINMWYQNNPGYYEFKYIYQLQSAYAVSYSNGYIKINFSGYNIRNNTELVKDKFIWNTGLFSIYASLVWGDKAWDGSNWVTFDMTTKFLIGIKDNSVVKNLQEIIETNGYYIPIQENMTGTITLVIWNVVNDNTFPDPFMWPGPGMDCKSVILSGLTVSWYTEDDEVTSGRRVNRYRQDIIMAGFSESKTQSLTIGTNNNNKYARNLLLNVDDVTYRETFQYMQKDRSSYYEQRPEMHLLGRLAQQYRKAKKTLDITIGNDIDTTRTLYSHLDRQYFAIEKEIDWRNDAMQIRLVEILQSENVQQNVINSTITDIESDPEPSNNEQQEE